MRIGERRLDIHCGSTGNFTWATKITVAKWVSTGGAFLINDFQGWLTRVSTVERHFSSGWIGES